MKSEYPKGGLENPLTAECCSAHSRKEVRPTLGALGEHFLDHARATFTVHGMTCGGCVKRINNALAKLPGVSGAVVDFESRQAIIDFDPEKVDSSSIRKTISVAGYAIEGDDDTGISVKKPKHFPKRASTSNRMPTVSLLEQPLSHSTWD